MSRTVKKSMYCFGSLAYWIKSETRYYSLGHKNYLPTIFDIAWLIDSSTVSKYDDF